MAFIWFGSLVIMAGSVFFFSRYFYKQRLTKLRYLHNASKSDLQRQIIASLMNKEKFETMLSSMVEGVIIVNPDGTLEHASPNFCRLLELRSKDTRGRLYWEVIWNQEINDSIKEALKHKRALKKEVDIIGPQEAFFSMQISPVVDKKGALQSLVAVFHDITKLKQVEKMRAEFVANVSHELKTPLTAIKGFVETLQGGAKNDPKSADRFLEIICKQTERLDNLVNDLLILSSLESKDVQMNIEPESLDKIIQSVLNLQKNAIDARGHHISINIPTDLPKILVDRLRAEQVFLNLIDNAIKFTPPQGSILIKVSVESPFIRIDVQDSGIGITPEHLSHVFERFYRADKARSREAGGTGLGLSIVHQIIQAHQGKIEVNSAPNLGTTFSVFLPHMNS